MEVASLRQFYGSFFIIDPPDNLPNSSFLCLLHSAPSRYAPCSMPYALCFPPSAFRIPTSAFRPMPYALCPMPHALCPLPSALSFRLPPSFLTFPPSQPLTFSFFRPLHSAFPLPHSLFQLLISPSQLLTFLPSTFPKPKSQIRTRLQARHLFCK